ncbi:F-box/WD repeat-containing protein 7 isoform X2 [Neoarius graeffei]|uniref:F-box/WD repeat-containing protein 7 isoform X2 n=1 Tax=Neoarius graeffei TaxID=443677 RepID=UPI00298BECB7|nr:F-box/WD repeat-containing protein 7 isoform X2 [Neoarius graeffei]
MGEVRKLQKKLRQIENLELKVSLNPEEAVKVSKKEELRSRLAELLLQLSGLQQTHCIVGEEEDKMKRQVENGTEQDTDHTPAVKLVREDHQEKEDKRKSVAEKEIKEREHGGQSQKLPDPDDEFTSLKALWEKAKFRLRTLKGHSDIITCVTAVDNLVISGSRDTTVKVWHVPTATEQHNLGGHSGGVTCLSTPPAEYCRKLASALHLSEKERFIISGSTDCCVRIWTLSPGQCVKSIYTFNAVTSLCFIAEWDGYIVTGSALCMLGQCLCMSQQWDSGCVTDAGKLQVWDWLSQENRQSVNAHLDAVTTLQSQGPLVFSGSTDGRLCVWEVCDEATEPLNQLQQWGSEVTGCSRVDEVNGRLSLSARGDHVFLANGRSSIRVLNWRTGTMRRLTNHSSTAGITDCVNQIPGVLVGSCFDLTSGENTLNLFSLPQCRYLVSLTSSDVPRILCFAAWLTPSGGHRWVTGGLNLTVWEQLQGNVKKRGDVNARRDSRLDGSLAESDGDSQEEESEDDDEDEDSMAMDAEEVSGWSWLRCVLQ